MPCAKCSKRSTCRRICPALEALLPKIHDSQVSGHAGGTDNLAHLLRQREATRTILGMRRLLPGSERVVVNLVFNREMTVEQAAEHLHTRPDTVRKYLARAYADIEWLLGRRRRRNGETNIA
jgi:DNA-directed RNA polymerase specialized sigma24 family protein